MLVPDRQVIRHHATGYKPTLHYHCMHKSMSLEADRCVLKIYLKQLINYLCMKLMAIQTHIKENQGRICYEFTANVCSFLLSYNETGLSTLIIFKQSQYS